MCVCVCVSVCVCVCECVCFKGCYSLLPIGIKTIISSLNL